MVRSRFDRLPEEQQRAILGAALDEFAAHGFHDASLNRVIAAAGVSKGSLYYHVDGKEDLYVHVARVVVGQLFDEVGPLPVPDADDADAFWATVESYYHRLMTHLAASPTRAAFVRGWLAASGNPRLQQAQDELGRAVLPWMEQAVAAGQAAGAVRTDLPSGLLVAVTAGMGQAMDTWLLTREPVDGELPELVGALVGMIRGAVRPLP